MNASIGFLTPAVFFTAGITGRTGLRSDHHAGAAVVAGAASDFAPPLIQSRSVFTSAAVSGVLPGGIWTSPSRRTALYSKLASAFPGTIAGPRLPPLRMVARSRRSRSDIRVGPWQLRHFASRIVRADFSTGVD